MHLAQSNGLAERSAYNGLKPDGVTVIVGAGAMGRLQVEIALSYLPRLVVVADFIEERLDLVKQLFSARASRLGVGLVTFNPAKADLKAFVNEQSGYHGADDVIIAVGARKAIEDAMGYLGREAVLNLFGGLKRGDEVVGFDTLSIHYQSINVTGSSGGSPWDIARTLELMVSGEIDPAVHITRIGDLEHAIELLKMFKAQQIDGKAVVYPHRRTGEIKAVKAWTAADEKKYFSGQG